MFTGIITDIGTVRSTDKRGDTRFVIGTSYDPASIALGASIACSGVCLTVVEKGTDADGNWFAVDVSAETLSRTTVGGWQADRKINLERALKMGDELGGHLVAGHVDCVGKIVAMQQDGDSWRLKIEIPNEFMRFAAEKGSIVVDGISLTINSITENSLNLNIVPHTLHVTTLGTNITGDTVNIEVDLIARYLDGLLAKRTG